MTSFLFDPQRMRLYAPAVVVFALTMLTTLIATSSVRRELTGRAELEFRSIASLMREELEDRIRYYEQSLSSAAGLLAVVPDPTRAQWNAFAANNGLPYRGVQGLGFATLVKGDPRPFEAEQRSLGRADFTVRPAGVRDEAAIIKYLAPEDSRNLAAIGFDMMSDPMRREAMQRARATGDITISGPVRLLQEIDSDVQTGVLMYRAVYAHQSLITQEQREQALIGFIYAPFRMRNLVESAFEPLMGRFLERVTYQLIDRSKHHDFPMVGATHAVDALFLAEQPIEARGRTWVLQVSAGPSFLKEFDRGAPMRTLLLGLLASTLVTAVTALLSMRQHTLSSHAHALTEEVERRRKSEQSLRLSNRELIHRVKNTLAIVSSLATQTSRHTSSMPEFLAAFRQRVNALGRVHDMLRAEHAFTPDFRSLVDQTLAPYASGNRGALEIEGPAVAVSQDQAVMYALLLNELGANATKYGAWSSRDGQVLVSWQLDKLAPDPQFTINWRERGGPRVTPPSRKGFGSALITFAVERSLRGKSQFSYLPEGVSVDISIPWSTAIAATDSWAGFKDLSPNSMP